ncbi:hypothetical protein [Frankia sp. AiPs1]|uniref:hypothetical protein n=1 Tax=Frankia sp. AiPs1 TaxID=573493 RepID=UPI0035ABF9F8
MLEAGADPNARTTGGGAAETPSHWAASSDDVDVAAALIDGGADAVVPALLAVLPLYATAPTGVIDDHPMSENWPEDDIDSFQPYHVRAVLKFNARK